MKLTELRKVIRNIIKEELIEASGYGRGNVSPEDLMRFARSREFQSSLPEWLQGGDNYALEKAVRKWVDANWNKFGTSSDARRELMQWASKLTRSSM